jgi:hypothetical protein
MVVTSDCCSRPSASPTSSCRPTATKKIARGCPVPEPRRVRPELGVAWLLAVGERETADQVCHFAWLVCESVARDAYVAFVHWSDDMVSISRLHHAISWPFRALRTLVSHYSPAKPSDKFAEPILTMVYSCKINFIWYISKEKII